MIFDSIKSDLKKAGIKYSVEEYEKIAIVSTISVFVTLASITYFVSLSFIISVIVGALGASSVLLTFYVYPSQIAEIKRKKIDSMLYFATSYMATIAGTGLPPQKIFETMSEFKEFGEINRECRKVVRYMDLYGLSLPEALEKVARETPSPNFREILWGMKTIITAGGNLQSYLLEKSNNLLYEFKRELETFSHNLSMILEIYTTIVIVGSIFALVLSAILSFFGAYLSIMRLVQVAIIVGFLPLATGIFALIFKIISPGE